MSSRELESEKNESVSCSVMSNSFEPIQPVDCSLPGSSVHGILQVRILERVAMPSSRASSQPRDQTQVSLTAGGFFTIWATREAPELEQNDKDRHIHTYSYQKMLTNDSKVFMEI